MLNEEEIEPASLWIAELTAAVNLPQPTESGSHTEKLVGSGAVVFSNLALRKRPRPHPGYFAPNDVP